MSSQRDNSFSTSAIVSGLLVTILGGVIVAVLAGEGRFSKPASAPTASVANEEKFMTPIATTVIQLPAIRETRDLSQDKFILSCRNVNRTNSDLRADCQTFDGKWNQTYLKDGAFCTSEVENVDGYLICINGDIPSIPQGTYQKTCGNITIVDNVLHATCKAELGVWHLTTFDSVSACTGHFINTDGFLICKVH